MKKVFAVLLCLTTVFCFSACNTSGTGVGVTTSSDKTAGETSLLSQSPTSTSQKAKKTSKTTTQRKTTPATKNSSSATKSSTTKTTSSTTSGNKSTCATTTTTGYDVPAQSYSSQSNTQTSLKTTVTNNNVVSEKIDNGVLEKATSQKMNVPENMKLLGTNNLKEANNSKSMRATVALYQLDGDVVNWLTEKDLIYVITSGNNRLVVINAKTMMPVCNVPLAGKPAEMNLIGDKIYISLPDLCRIDIFSKSNFAKVSSLYFEHEVSSFCVDSNYIYYSTHNQHCDVYKKNMTTKELVTILPDRGFTFSQPKLYLNKQDNLLYIGETGTTGSTLFYYDATTLQIKSLFRKNDYGIMNHTRDIFHVGDEIFWGNYRLSDTNAKQIAGRYGVVDYGSVNFASPELVSTFEGLFLADTYECIVNYFDAGFRFEYILVSESYNVFFRARGIDTNIILGVNFSVQ